MQRPKHLAPRHIYSRSEWGARSARDNRLVHGNRPPVEAFIHNTADANYRDFRTLPLQKRHMRAIQDFHLDGRGWADIGYHFVVFQPTGNVRNARIFRGRRSSDIVPAAQEGHNTHTLAIAVVGMGDTDPLLGDTKRAIVWLLGHYKGVRALGGHRDASSSECPGEHFYRAIPELAKRANLRLIHPERH